MMRCLSKIIVLALWIVLQTNLSSATDWISLMPNPAYTRDLSMGGSTIAELYAPQSQSINPAGFSFYNSQEQNISTGLLINPGGLWQVSNYFDKESEKFSASQNALDISRLVLHGGVAESKFFTLALLLSEPVTDIQDSSYYRNFENKTSLASHQNSILLKLSLHPRVSLGGRIDRYYRYNRFDGEAYSYGLILRPRGINVGVQYQSFPMNNSRTWHPLDRRCDGATSAGISITPSNLTLTFAVMNLTQSEYRSFLEPHAGVEWRPLRALALRAGGMQFSKSSRWAVTAGFGLFDANWFRKKMARLAVPDEILQFAVGIIYKKRVPELGIGSLSLAWRL